MFKVIRNAINELKEGFKKGYAEAVAAKYTKEEGSMAITSIPSEIVNTYHHYPYEQVAASMLKHYGLAADVYVKDSVIGIPACVVATKDLVHVNIDVKTKNDTIIIFDRTSMAQNLNALMGMDPALEDMDIQEWANLVTAHELGHIYMNHMHSEEHKWKKNLYLTSGPQWKEGNKADYIKAAQITVKQELEAWEAGKQFIPAEMHPMYDAFNKINIESYRSQLNYQLKEEAV